MLLEKRELFKRKNRTDLYNNYINDYEYLSDLCFEYQSTLKCLDTYIKETSSKKYLYTYLLNVKEMAEDPAVANICLKYKLCSTSKSFTASVEDHAKLYSNINTLSDIIGYMYSALALVDYLTDNGLTVRKS